MDLVTYVTFIIPTLGRPSLSKAVESVINQQDWNWKCIVVFDGIKPNIEFSNDHIKVISCDKKYNAGLVRNEAFPLVDTKWIAFLDDDDFIVPDYTHHLKISEISHSNADIIQFTYKDISNGNTRPTPKLGNVPRLGEMGISFAIKTEFVYRNSLIFRKVPCEDYHFLQDAVNKGAVYYNTDILAYYVGKRSAWL